jgi:hypothetical protein
MTYSFLQVALEEEKDKVEESRRLHEADKKLISELRYEVEQLQIELEVRRQDLVAQKETMNAERNRSENERKETDRLEAERKEELRIKTEENLRIQNEQKNDQKKVERSETFSEFYSENVRIKKVQDEQKEQEKKNEIFLKQQQFLLDETVRILSLTTIGKSQDARFAEVDVNLAGQIRYIQSTFCTFHGVFSVLICANYFCSQRPSNSLLLFSIPYPHVPVAFFERLNYMIISHRHPTILSTVMTPSDCLKNK